MFGPRSVWVYVPAEGGVTNVKFPVTMTATLAALLPAFMLSNSALPFTYTVDPEGKEPTPLNQAVSPTGSKHPQLVFVVQFATTVQVGVTGRPEPLWSWVPEIR